MAKTLHLLIGPKGAGKTTIGKVIEKHTGIRFLMVEPIWLSLQAGEDGWVKMESEVDRIFRDVDELIIESLGKGEGFERFRDVLAGQYRIRYKKVSADPSECSKRVKLRDGVGQIPVSLAKVEDYKRIAIQTEHPWDIEIDNNGQLIEESIVRSFAGAS